MTVAALQRSITVEEFNHWIAYHRLRAAEMDKR